MKPLLQHTMLHGSLLRLMHLVSPALPIGAYAFSQAMESAVAHGHVCDESTAGDWVRGVISHGSAYLDVPVALRLYNAWQADDLDAVAYWNSYLFASRESAELQMEDQHLGRALARLLETLGVQGMNEWRRRDGVCFATLFTAAANTWHIPVEATLHGLLWTWLENQVAAATRLVPLGQSSAQRIIATSIEHIELAVTIGAELIDDDIGAALPAWVALSVRHEEQYSRLFQS